MRTTTIDVALPVLNEEHILEKNVRTLIAELSSRCSFDWSLSVVDNGSTDASWEIACDIAQTERTSGLSA